MTSARQERDHDLPPKSDDSARGDLAAKGSASGNPPDSTLGNRLLGAIEWAGNRLPDPAMLFVWALLITWGTSWWLSRVTFREINPENNEPIQVVNQLGPKELTTFMADMVKTFVEFPPLGLVLVALLGVGVAEHTGFVQAIIKCLLLVTPDRLLTPMVILVALLSHSAGDSGYVLVIPLGGVIFAAARRHPVAGIAAAFAGVSGGFSANFIPSSLDTLLQGFTQKAAQIVDPDRAVNPLCNLAFMSASCVLIVAIGWFLTDRIIEPRLNRTSPLDDERLDPTMSPLGALTDAEWRGVLAGGVTLAVLAILLIAAAAPVASPLRGSEGGLTQRDAPLMKAIVPLIFLAFLVPGTVHGYVSGTVKSHRDVVQAMSKSMSTMGHYLVMAFFAAQFTHVFRQSNVGVLLAVKGANSLEAVGLPPQVTIIGVILFTACVNLLIGSASAKWALLSPIFVPMLMQLGLSPELTQAAYRIGDSGTNIITPLNPYFPLVVVYAQRYVKQVGVGTMVSLMVPYSVAFLIGWTALLLLFWALGIPLGVQSTYEYAG